MKIKNIFIVSLLFAPLCNIYAAGAAAGGFGLQQYTKEARFIAFLDRHKAEFDNYKISEERAKRFFYPSI